MNYSTKEEILAEFNKCPDMDPPMTMGKLQEVIKGHIMSGNAGRYVLNSGGPRMVIATAPSVCVGDTFARASCTWIAPSGKAQGASFKSACLREPTPRDEWEWRQAGRLPTYARRTAAQDETTICQDCGRPARPTCYGLRRFRRGGPGGGVEVVDWMNLCGPCAKARGFLVAFGEWKQRDDTPE